MQGNRGQVQGTELGGVLRVTQRERWVWVPLTLQSSGGTQKETEPQRISAAQASA